MAFALLNTTYETTAPSWNSSQPKDGASSHQRDPHLFNSGGSMRAFVLIPLAVAFSLVAASVVCH